MVPVLFAYGGWQTATFVAGEIREPRKNLPRALIIGVTGVVLLYLVVNFVCVSVLGVSGLANTTTPASDVMRLALGPTGARLIAAGIAISTLGFLSQGMLTAPRVYFAMAEDGLFFQECGPAASKDAGSDSGDRYSGTARDRDRAFRSLRTDSQLCSLRRLHILRRYGAVHLRLSSPQKGSDADHARGIASVPGHPVTTAVFVAVCWLVVINTVYRYPQNTLIGVAILLAGIPAFFFWRWRNTK